MVKLVGWICELIFVPYPFEIPEESTGSGGVLICDCDTMIWCIDVELPNVTNLKFKVGKPIHIYLS